MIRLTPRPSSPPKWTLHATRTFTAGADVCPKRGRSVRSGRYVHSHRLRRCCFRGRSRQRRRRSKPRGFRQYEPTGQRVNVRLTAHSAALRADRQRGGKPHLDVPTAALNNNGPTSGHRSVNKCKTGITVFGITAIRWTQYRRSAYIQKRWWRVDGKVDMGPPTEKFGQRKTRCSVGVDAGSSKVHFEKRPEGVRGYLYPIGLTRR